MVGIEVDHKERNNKKGFVRGMNHSYTPAKT